MRTIEVSDEVYEKLKKVAEQRAMSVEAYLDDVTQEDDLSHLFTPERIAEWNRIADEMENGGESYTTEEVWASLEAHKVARKATRA